MASVLIFEDQDGKFWCEHDAYNSRERETTLLESDNLDDAINEAQTLTDCREDEISW